MVVSCSCTSSILYSGLIFFEIIQQVNAQLGLLIYTENNAQHWTENIEMDF